MKNSKKNIACFLLTVFFISSFGINSFANTDSALSYITTSETITPTKTVLDPYAFGTTTPVEKDVFETNEIMPATEALAENSSTAESTTTDVTGIITWAEEAPTDAKGYLQLYQGSTSYGSPVALDGIIDKSLTSDGSGELEAWKYTWKRIPSTDSSNTAYTYTVKEVDSAGADYTPASYTKMEEGLTVTNTKIKVTDSTADDTLSTSWIASDLKDYPPGALVTITGGGWTGDSEVKIVIEGSSSPTQVWRQEKVVPVTSDGLIELKFNLPEWYVPQYNVTATGLTTGRVASTTFTDSGGAYSLDFSAYDPRYYTYKLPNDYPTPPSGRAADPMPGANGSNTPLNSLEPRDMALGQIVPFEVEITVNGSTAPEGGIINFACLWSTTTTAGSNFGYDPTYMVFAAFVDYADPRSIDNGVLASATILSSVMSGANIKGTFKVSGLENGDKIIVEMWVVLKKQLSNNVSGNVPSTLDSAQTATGERINTGSQTVPLNQTAKFTTEIADVSIIKVDAPDPLYTGETLKYNITVTNNSTTVVANGIVVTDTIDPKVTFASATGGGTLSGSLITWAAFALEPLTQKTFTVTVNVNSDAPTEIYGGTSPAAGSATGTRLTNVDISNIVQFTMITQDSNYNNNVWQEPTNILPRVSVTARKVWIGGQAADHQPVVMVLYRKVGSGTPEEVNGVTPTITPSAGPAGTFTYLWTGLPMYNPSFQPYIYTADESTVPANYTKTITANNTITNTYKPSLTILKVYGETPLQSAVFSLYEGNASGPTGGSLVTITTGSDGKATFEHLADGTYWLVETKPPTGYKWTNDIGPLIVVNGTITGPGGYTPAADGATGNYIVTVQNYPIRELPAAGGIGTIPFAIGGLGMMIFAIYFKKKKED